MFALEAFMPRFKTIVGAIFFSLDILSSRDILNLDGFSYAFSCAFSAKGFWKNPLCDFLFWSSIDVINLGDINLYLGETNKLPYDNLF